MATALAAEPKTSITLVSTRDLSLKRQALQIAALLPDSEEDALAVLEHAKTLVRSFLGPTA